MRLTNTASIEEILLLNSTRGKTFSWSELYSITGRFPSSIQRDLESMRQQNAQLIDPLWICTQSAKNTQTAFTRSQLSMRLIQNYSKPHAFQANYDNYGISLNYNSQRSQSWLIHVMFDDWFWKQLFCLSYFSAFYDVPGVLECRLISSTMMRVSKPSSDVDIMVKVKPGYVYSTRQWIKFILLKVTGRDVHTLYLELLSWMNDLAEYFFPYLYSHASREHLHTKIERTIAQRKSNTNRIKIDLGILYDDFGVVKKNYGTEMRQRVWLYENAKVCSNLRQVLDTVSQGDAHILYYHKYARLARIKAAITFPLTRIGWLVSYPATYLQKMYYRFKKVSSCNYAINDRIIGFVPRIYKDGYYKKYK